ncbi:MAG: multiheme c-type cytochrome [Candidatus Poribacteria bacterium]|nr:multiheme c-type cytochrome [Candidatus Poribacteria bacterium]
MKKYILLLLFLTAIVVGPFAYQRWSEAKRLRHIRETKQTAAQIHATPLKGFLQQLDQASPHQTVLVLFTGNTQAHLEPCGCFIGQSGGLPRRATAISSIKDKGFSPLLVDLGGFLPVEPEQMKSGLIEQTTELDQLRAQTTFTAMEMMDYDVLVSSQPDENAIDQTLTNYRFQLLDAHSKASSPEQRPYLIKTVGSKRIAFVELSLLETEQTVSIPKNLDSLLSEVQAQANVVIISSHLQPEVNRSLAKKYPNISAIMSRDTGETERVGNVLLTYCYPHGKTLGALILTDAAGQTSVAVEQIALTEDVSDDPNVRKLLNDFYEQVASDPQLQVASYSLFSSEALEQDSNNSYIGSAACQECHKKEFDQWSHSSHATAFNTLQIVGREYYSKCVSCHVTGFGYASGYQIGASDRAHLAEVGCETCHGPGKQHTYTPLATNIRGKVEASTCMECHQPEHSPGFEQLVAQLMPEVDHSRTDPSLKQILEQRGRGPIKPQVELFVMSYCSYAVDAEKELLPFFSKYIDEIDFKLRFIVSKKPQSADEVDEDPEFISLHGETELIENLRQMVIAELYPDQYFDYLLCRADHLKEAWTLCAQKMGLDVEKIASMVEMPETRHRFLQDIQRKEELGIQGSPTLVIDGRVIGGQLWRGKVRETCQ